MLLVISERTSSPSFAIRRDSLLSFLLGSFNSSWSFYIIFNFLSFFFLGRRSKTVNDIDGFCVVKFISIWWSKMILGPRKFYFFLIHFFMFLFIFLCFSFVSLIAPDRSHLLQAHLLRCFFSLPPPPTPSFEFIHFFCIPTRKARGNLYSFIQFPHFHTINIDNERWLGGNREKTANKWAKRDRSSQPKEKKGTTSEINEKTNDGVHLS